MGIIAKPFGWLMKGCYMLVKNYGLALLIFTLITRIITLPVYIKQQKNTARMNMLQPEIEKLKKKYGKNQDKLNEEMMKVYTEANYNPMSSCLPMFIPLIIIYAMIPVVYGPLTYISNADKAQIKSDSAYLQNAYAISTEVDKDKNSIETMLEGTAADKRAEQLEKLLTDEEKYPDSAKLLGKLTDEEKQRIINSFADFEGLDKFITNGDNFTQNLMRSSYGPEVLLFNFHSKADGKYLGVLSSSVQDAIKDFDYTMLGLELGKIPTKSDNTKFIPYASFIIQIISMVISQIFAKKNNPAMKMSMAMLIPLFLMPLFSLWIGFKFPCALGIYWIYSSAFAFVQTIFLNLIYTPARVQALVDKDIKKQKEKRKKKGPSFMERALEIRDEQMAAANGQAPAAKKRVYADDDDDESDVKLTKAQQKELNRKKLNEARKRYAEKYGDEYTEE